jgi:hypothetical protein
MTAIQQPETKSTSRRALLAGALGGLGAWAASAIGRADPARAVNGDPVTVGGTLTGTATTKITNTDPGESAIWGNASNATGTGIGVRGDSASAGYGVWGRCPTGWGVFGDSTSSYGVYGHSTSSAGVRGESTSWFGVHGKGYAKAGVYGESTSNIGVYGFSSATDQPASRGWSYGNATGVQGVSGTATLPAATAKTGVFGYADQDSSSVGVRGESPAGFGIYGKTTGTGFAGYFNGKVYSTSFYELAEIAAPAAPVDHRARLFLRDFGGKAQLCVRFNTGAVQVLATEP